MSPIPLRLRPQRGLRSHTVSAQLNLKGSRLLTRDTELLPFETEDDLRRAFEAAHDLIYKHLARDPAASFDLLSLVIAAKILDEQSDAPDHEFATVEGEAPDVLMARFDRLLVDAQEWLDLRTDEVHLVPSLRLDASLASALARIFEDYSLTRTAASLAGADALGTAYEAMVGATFRGELGAYFTPRHLSDFIARMLNVRSGRVLDPACGTGGLLIAAHRYAASSGGDIECFANDINPRMVHAARVNFLLHGLDRSAVRQGDGLDVARMLAAWFGDATPADGAWWSVVRDGRFDAVIANPPFAGHEQDVANLRRIETAHRDNRGLRSLNRAIPFLEVIVSMLRIGGAAGIVLPTSVLNAEEESFVRFRELLLNHAEIRAIVGLPERAFIHTDCGVHGALLFLERVKKPREDYEVFVAWADRLGYDRLGRDVPDNDLPGIVAMFHGGVWPVDNTVSIRQLQEWGRFDPAWVKIARVLPSPEERDDGSFTALTELVEVRNARFSRRTLDPDATYRYFEVADTNIETGEVVAIREARGWEIQRKSRIKNVARQGDVLLPNHRDSLIARSAPTGRSAVLVGEDADGVLTTDRFIVLRPRIDPTLAVAVLNSAGVRRQLVAQTRGAASLDVRERTLASVLVPTDLVRGSVADQIVGTLAELKALRSELAAKVDAHQQLVDEMFGGAREFRPAAFHSR
jgi:SAM-dependent methyltransferase